ncbi:MAG TPA: ABC transporter ATP-binding protein, partial [Anaerolineae bacterium]|nr:ABC transporter ATP-binding protein [Anaerolineae bacterium]
FPLRGGLFQKPVGNIRAVDGVDLDIHPGESFGLVGESGSGKTTLGKTILRLIEPTGGQIIFEGQDICALPEKKLRSYRAYMQMVFQDPYSSLNPRMKVKHIVAEPLVIHGRARGAALEERVRELLTLVGLGEDHLHRFPHEFSGGQRQRIGVARALALEPKLLVLDEPTSALDVSVQAQVLNLLIELQQRMNLTYLFISHDLGVIRYICDRVALMYLGKIVETGTVEQIFQDSKHPYTRALLSAMPEPDPDYQGEEIVLEGEIPLLTGPVTGCRFASRCPAHKVAACYEVEPPLLDIGDNHYVACHLYA